MEFMCINLYNTSVKEGSEESIVIKTILFFSLKIILIYLVYGHVHIWGLEDKVQ